MEGVLTDRGSSSVLSDLVEAANYYRRYDTFRP
jgi:hypothetical protein